MPSSRATRTIVVVLDLELGWVVLVLGLEERASTLARVRRVTFIRARSLVVLLLLLLEEEEEEEDDEEEGAEGRGGAGVRRRPAASDNMGDKEKGQEALTRRE